MEVINPVPEASISSTTQLQRNRPLITYDGDITIFQSITPYLQKGIGAETVEWKRAYGRSTKHVHLHPKFIPFSYNEKSNAFSSAVPSSTPLTTGQEEIIPTPTPKEIPPITSLLDQQMLHTYWTDCPDVEVYKSTTKDSIQSWLNNVKECNIKDWFIILVETPDNKKAKQLLPRSSVLDKIKNDFAQKQTERCICLSDPNKLDSKSAESLHAMLHRLRQLILSSYSKTLTKFEENMREKREKRNEPGWNFCHYFLLQEELALVLEMLEVYDEALVQYDELDALFTQFVLNSHLTGNTHHHHPSSPPLEGRFQVLAVSLDTPQWLLSFQRFGDHWPALTLSSSDSSKVLLQIRDTMKSSTISLLNFRNYLFIRQATLLVQQKRVNELAQRSLGFLHNCINELAILDVNFNEEGAISAWIFVSCLEILEVICDYGQGSQTLVNGLGEAVKIGKLSSKSGSGGHTNQQQTPHQNLMPASDFSVHTASIWDYAREKLYDMGRLHGLLPKSQPRSDHLHKVLSLSAGLMALDNNIISSTNDSKVDNTTNGDSCHVNSNDLNKIINNFHISTIPIHDLSRETPIEKLKNALSSKEQFQHHYLELCELGMGTFKHIGRLRSARKVGLNLAEFYVEAEEYQKAIGFLSDALKTFECDRWDHLVVAVLLQLIKCYLAIDDMERYILTCKQLACSPVLENEKRLYYFDELMNYLLKYKDESPIFASFDDTIGIESVAIESPGKIDLDSCSVTVIVHVLSSFPKAITNCRIESALLSCDHKKNTTEIRNVNLASASFSSSMGAPLLSKGSARKSHHADSNKSGDNAAIAACEEEDTNLSLSEINDLNNMKLKLGQHFDVKPDKTVQAGKLFCQNSHLALRRKDSQMKDDLQKEKTDFSIAAISEDITLSPGSNSVTLNAKINKPGAYRLGQLSVKIKQLELLSRRMGCRYNFTIEKVPGTVALDSDDANLNLIAGLEQIISLKLSTGSNRIEQGVFLKVRASLGLQLKISENAPLSAELSAPLLSTNSFSTTIIQLRVKAELGPQKDNNPIEHKLMITCPWTTDETKLSIVFVPPFRSSYKLNTVGSRKFLQILLHGLSSSDFVVSNHQLSIQGSLSQLIPIVQLNPKSQELVLTTGHSVSYMWEVGIQDLDDENPIRLEFSATFHPYDNLHQQTPELYKYYVCLQRFKTQYEIGYRIEPHKGVEFCRVGNMCSMIIDIQKVDKRELVENSLMYEVRADQYMWAICGKTAGVISMEGSDIQQVKLDVMPMSAGFLLLPTVHLSKYVLADRGGVPKLESFNSGQVFNKCKGSQIHILPPPQVPSSNLGSIGSAGVASAIVQNTTDAHF